MGVLDSIRKVVDPFGMFNPSEGYKDAAKEMEKYWQQAVGFQKPFMEAGKAQLPILRNAESTLFHPEELLGQWMQKYQMSPYAQRSMENAKASGLDTASSMGLLGSSPALANIQQSSSDIMNADRDKFLADLMQKFMAGIGIGQDIYGKGAGTAANLGKQAIGVGENMGQAAYGAANANGDMMRNLLGMAAKGFMQSQMGGVGG